MPPEPISEGPRQPRQATTPGQETSVSELEALAAEVGRVLPLRPGEKQSLLEKVRQSGDQAACERLLETHLGLVLEMAKARKGRGLTVGDFFQEGCVGLLAAIKAFPLAEDGDFDHFAAAQVALAMEGALLAEEEAVRQERLLLDAAADYDRVEIALAGELHRAPTVAEIGVRLEWTPERTEYVRTVVEDARRRNDAELLLYVEPEEVTDLLGEAQFGPN